MSLPSLGTNLAPLTDYTREWPFVDAFKIARPWISQRRGAPWGQGGPLQLTAQGWIAALQPGQYAETIMFDNALDDKPSYPTGRYTLLYEGRGTIQFDHGSATVVSRFSGRMLVNVSPGQNGIFLMITEVDSRDPIRNIRFIMPGFEHTYRTQPFHPIFLQTLAKYRVLRFMEWMRTNGSPLHSWTDRPTPDDYTYAWRGAPLEIMIRLANQLHAEPWFTIPHQADDNFVHYFATMVKDQLNPSLVAYVEYSNETWNSRFTQSRYVQARGQQLQLDKRPFWAGVDFTALRSVEIFSIFADVLGGTTRIRRVLASQAANSSVSDRLANFRNAARSADVLAIAPYFSCSDAESGGHGYLGDARMASQIAHLSSDRILDIELEHIRNCSANQMKAAAAIARTHRLALVAYEGGQHLVGVNGAENNGELTGLFSSANRSPRMRTLYSEYLRNWVSCGGSLFVNFNDVGAYTKWGSWGAMEYQDQDPSTAPKYQALMDFAVQNR